VLWNTEGVPSILERGVRVISGLSDPIDPTKTDGHEEVNTLRAKVLALEAKLDSFSQAVEGNWTAARSARRQRNGMRKNATTAKRLASGSKGTMYLNVGTRRRMKQKQCF
jgi:hypothetical protein